MSETTPENSPDEPSAARLVLSLGLAGLVAGLALVGVYLETAPRIAENQAEFLREKIFELFPDAESVEPYVVRDGELVLYEGDPAELSALEVVYAGLDGSGSVVGNAIAAEGPGFMDTIRLLYAFDRERRTIVGMRVLESKETPGLGDKIAKDDAFLSNFAQLVVEPEIIATKNGEGTANNHVDCITGATISSKAVVRILNRSMEQWLPVFDADGSS